jgi:ligand-binding sensor domain-containing protein
MKGKRRHWAELLPENTGVMSKKINCISIDALGHLWVGTDEGLNIYDCRNYWF